MEITDTGSDDTVEEPPIAACLRTGTVSLCAMRRKAMPLRSECEHQSPLRTTAAAAADVVDDPEEDEGLEEGLLDGLLEGFFASIEAGRHAASSSRPSTAAVVAFMMAIFQLPRLNAMCRHRPTRPIGRACRCSNGACR